MAPTLPNRMAFFCCDGGSERLVGNVLQALFRAGELEREEVVIVSKAGYVQGQNLQLAQEREKVFAEILQRLNLRPATENFEVSRADSTTTSQLQRGASVRERVAGWKKYLSAAEIAVIENVVTRLGFAGRLLNDGAE